VTVAWDERRATAPLVRPDDSHVNRKTRELDPIPDADFFEDVVQCVLTVTSLIPSRAATSALRRPSATWRIISRPVRDSQRVSAGFVGSM
jgi:hypothetical protein